MGAVISTEMRAANNANGMTRPGSTDPVGVNGWGPNINVNAICPTYSAFVRLQICITNLMTDTRCVMRGSFFATHDGAARLRCPQRTRHLQVTLRQR
jgi:hypothetical protein